MGTIGEALDPAVRARLAAAVKADAPADHKQGAMIALRPSLDVAAALAVPNGLPPEDLHVTLVYLGPNAEGITGTDGSVVDRGEVEAVVEAVAARHSALSGVFHGLIQWDAGDEGMAYMAAVDVPGLVAFRQDLVAALAADMIESPSEHDFTPHVTLAYGGEAPPPVERTEVTFGSVVLVWADDETEFPLGAELDEDPAGESDETKDATMQREHKALPISGFKVLSEDQGIVRAVVSVTGIVDEVNDRILPGAYEKTLSRRLPKCIWSHDWDTPIGKAINVRELMPGDKDLPKTLANGDPWPAEAGALLADVQFNLGTQRGAEAYSDVKFYGADQEWSIGYNVPAGKASTKSGVREIAEMDLFEFSPVLFGAMPLATTQSVKTAQEAIKAARRASGATSWLAQKAEAAAAEAEAEAPAEQPDADDDEGVDLTDALTSEEVAAMFQAMTDEDLAEMDRLIDLAETRAGAKALGSLEGKAKGGADKNAGNAEQLRNYWVRGEGAAKIRWGTDGDWTRCVRLLTEHLGPRAKGYCTLRHHDALGYYPGDKGKPGNPKAATVGSTKRYGRTPETKYWGGALTGSLEERMESLRRAVYEWSREQWPAPSTEVVAAGALVADPGWTDVLATFEDRVIVQRNSSGEQETYEVPYVWVDGKVEFGTPVPVQVRAVVTGTAAEVPKHARRLAAQIKAGRVLSAANLARIKAAHEALSEVMASAEVRNSTPPGEGTVAEKRRFTVEDVKALRYVRTAAGARRYGVPINSLITVDEDGNATAVARPDADTAEGASTGRGPTGRLRNVRQMQDAKLERELARVIDEGDDTEAIEAFTAEALRRGLIEDDENDGLDDSADLDPDNPANAGNLTPEAARAAVQAFEADQEDNLGADDLVTVDTVASDRPLIRVDRQDEDGNLSSDYYEIGTHNPVGVNASGGDERLTAEMPPERGGPTPEQREAAVEAIVAQGHPRATAEAFVDNAPDDAWNADGTLDSSMGAPDVPTFGDDDWNEGDEEDRLNAQARDEDGAPLWGPNGEDDPIDAIFRALENPDANGAPDLGDFDTADLRAALAELPPEDEVARLPIEQELEARDAPAPSDEVQPYAPAADGIGVTGDGDVINLPTEMPQPRDRGQAPTDDGTSTRLDAAAERRSRDVITDVEDLLESMDMDRYDSGPQIRAALENLEDSLASGDRAQVARDLDALFTSLRDVAQQANEEGNRTEANTVDSYAEDVESARRAARGREAESRDLPSTDDMLEGDDDEAPVDLSDYTPQAGADSWLAVADEVNDGNEGDLTLDDLDPQAVAEAERFAQENGLEWPPSVGALDRDGETAQRVLREAEAGGDERGEAPEFLESAQGGAQFQQEALDVFEDFGRIDALRGVLDSDEDDDERDPSLMRPDEIDERAARLGFTDASEMLDMAEEWQGLGWAVQEQAREVLSGQPVLSDLNPNALRMIGTFFGNVADRMEPGSEQGETWREIAGQLEEWLENVAGVRGKAAMGGVMTKAQRERGKPLPKVAARSRKSVRVDRQRGGSSVEKTVTLSAAEIMQAQSFRVFV